MEDGGLGADLVDREQLTGRHVQSRFDTSCPLCRHDINPGDPVYLTTYDRWVCDTCAMNFA